MSKNLVGSIPLKAEECPFSEYICFTGRYKCGFKEGMSSRCGLEYGKECDMLEENRKDENSNGESS